MIEFLISKKKALQYISILLILFCFRVLAQFLQLNNKLPFLPDFEAWYNNVIAYNWLLLSQIVIIILVAAVLIRIHKNLYQSTKVRSRWLLGLGAVYFVTMMIRFILSITLLQSHSWFGANLPAFFHMVLAGIILILGLYEYSTVKQGQYT